MFYSPLRYPGGNGYLIKSKVSRATCYMTNPEVVEEG